VAFTSSAEHEHDENELSDEYAHCWVEVMVEFAKKVELALDRSVSRAFIADVMNESRPKFAYTDDARPLSPPYTHAPFAHAGNEQIDTQVEPVIEPTDPL
jgi:hypothetical protein